MHLTLFVPDLLWPDHDNTRAYDFHGQQDLARLLALAKHERLSLSATDSWESLLAVEFGFQASTAPLAPCRWLGESGSPDSLLGGQLLCADPVNLDFVQQFLVLSDLESTQPATEATSQLLAGLNDEFKGEGHFFAGPGNDGTRRWYFRPDPAAEQPPNLAACSRFLGRRIDADETRHLLGSAGLRWINRIQMCLTQHPVNQDREMQGLPIINSIWPWGLAQLPIVPPQQQPSFQVAVGQHPLLAGLCEMTGTTYNPPEEADSKPMLVLDLSAISGVVNDDLSLWQASIGHLTKTWITPSMTHLTEGTRSQITLVSPNEHWVDRWTLDNNTPGLKPGLLQRLLGGHQKSYDLATVIRSW